MVITSLSGTFQETSPESSHPHKADSKDLAEVVTFLGHSRVNRTQVQTTWCYNKLGTLDSSLSCLHASCILTHGGLSFLVSPHRGSPVSHGPQRPTSPSGNHFLRHHSVLALEHQAPSTYAPAELWQEPWNGEHIWGLCLPSDHTLDRCKSTFFQSPHSREYVSLTLLGGSKNEAKNREQQNQK